MQRRRNCDPHAPLQFAARDHALGYRGGLVIGFGLLALPFIQRYAPFGGELEATVQAAEGQVFQIADTTSTPIIMR